MPEKECHEGPGCHCKQPEWEPKGGWETHTSEEASENEKGKSIVTFTYADGTTKEVHGQGRFKIQYGEIDWNTGTPLEWLAYGECSSFASSW